MSDRPSSRSVDQRASAAGSPRSVGGVAIPDPPLLTRLMIVRETRVECDTHRLEAARRFYRDWLELPEWPRSACPPTMIGFGPVRCGLLLARAHDALLDPMRRRLALTVASLAALERRLVDNEWPCSRLHGLSVCDQLLITHDPSGHRLEIRQHYPM